MTRSDFDQWRADVAASDDDHIDDLLAIGRLRGWIVSGRVVEPKRQASKPKRSTNERMNDFVRRRAGKTL